VLMTALPRTNDRNRSRTALRGRWLLRMVAWPVVERCVYIKKEKERRVCRYIRVGDSEVLSPIGWVGVQK
jgi:hypothetical protein